MSRIQRMLTPALVVFIALITTACGFQLRGAANIASELESLAVQSSDRDFQKQLSKTLEQTGIKITPAAPYQINIVDVQYQEQAASTSGGTIVTDYDVIASLVWSLETSKGLTLITPHRIQEQSTYQRRNDQYNAAQTELAAVKNNLRNNLATTLTRQIAALTNKQLSLLEQQARQKQNPEKTQQTGNTGPKTP